MPAGLTLPLRPRPPPQDSRPSSTTIPSQQASFPAARGSAPAPSARPQREAATKARNRVEEAHNFYPSEQDQGSGSEATSRRPSTPRPNPVHSDDSSDSGAFADDSESDCPRPSRARPGMKRKRSALPTMDEGERRNNKAAKLDMGDGKRKDGATGFMVKSGNVMRSILLEKASRAPRKSSARPWGKIQTSSKHLHIRRARLSGIGLDAGSNMSGRDEVWTKAPKRFS